MADRLVEIWWMNLEEFTQADVEAWLPLLSEEEQARVHRFAKEVNKIGFVAGRAIARTLLSSVSGQHFDFFEFPIGENGKPRLESDNTENDYFLSVSHSKGLVAVGVGKNLDLGLDIENLERLIIPRAIHSFLPDKEKKWLQDTPIELMNENYLRLWTLKEAYVKATGLGLSQSLDAFWFEQTDPPTINFSDEICDDPSAWHFEQKTLDRSVISSVAFRNTKGGMEAGT
jgi:4'-phosphopantetheinyl transferase